MSKPDWRDVEELTDLDPEYTNHVSASMVERMGKNKPALGRFCIVEAYGSVWLFLDAWKEVPEDQGPDPTAADVPVGFS